MQNVPPLPPERKRYYVDRETALEGLSESSKIKVLMACEEASVYRDDPVWPIICAISEIAGNMREAADRAKQITYYSVAIACVSVIVATIALLK